MTLSKEKRYLVTWKGVKYDCQYELTTADDLHHCFFVFESSDNSLSINDYLYIPVNEAEIKEIPLTFRNFVL